MMPERDRPCLRSDRGHRHGDSGIHGRLDAPAFDPDLPPGMTWPNVDRSRPISGPHPAGVLEGCALDGRVRPQVGRGANDEKAGRGLRAGRSGCGRTRR